MDDPPPQPRWLSQQIEQHGFAVPVVLSSSAYIPSFAYTTGLHLHGLPELLLVGLGQEGGALIGHLGRAALDGSLRLEPGYLHERSTRRCGSTPSCRWAEHYALYVRLFESGRNADVLQVVLPDPDLRWPEDPRTDRTWASIQPLLSRTNPFRVPVECDRTVDRYDGARARDPQVLVRVVQRGSAWNGLFELVRARPQPDGTFKTVQPPCVADWLAAGARVRLGPPPTDVDDPEDCAGFADEVVDEGPLRNVWFVQQVKRPNQRARVRAAFDQLTASCSAGRLVLSTACCSWHVSAAQPEAVRARLRPLMRDRLLQELPLVSAPRSEVCNHPQCSANGW